MAKKETILENKEQYDERIESEIEAERLKQMTSPWFSSIKRFFQDKAKQAHDSGDVALSNFWVDSGNEFFKGQLTYIALGYEPAKENGHLLPVDESRKRTMNAKARIRKYKPLVGEKTE